MSSKPLLLEGHVDTRQQEIEDLQSVVGDLESQIATLRAQIQQVQRGVFKMLSPLYMALKPIFDEMEPVSDAPQSSMGKQAQWESVKQRLQPRHREVIDVLLLQGEMGRKQIASAIKMDYTNCCKNVIGPLIRQGWLVESGGKIALKTL